MMRSLWILAMVLMVLMIRGSDAKLDIIANKQDVPLGEEILLICKAIGEGEIAWQKDGEDMDEDLVEKMDESTSKVIIKKASMQDRGRYTCTCDYESGHKDEAQTQVFVYEGPSFGSTAVYHEFLEGTNGTVPCLVSGQPAVDVFWYKDNEEIDANGRKRARRLPDKTLLIEGVRREDAGTYHCVANIKGRPIQKQLSISVVVNAPPTVHLKAEEKTVIAGPGVNVSLHCLADGLPKPNITWSMPVPFDPEHHHFNSDRSELTIRSVVRADFGEYVCTASNKIGENSATITLHVYEAPQVFVSADQLLVSLGQHVSVSCNVSGYPEPTLHWISKSNGQTLDSTSGHARVIDGVLEIDEVVPSDGGLYSCMAVSFSGNASRDVAILTKPGAPLYFSITTKSTSVFFGIKIQPSNGGTPITSFVLQWREDDEDVWQERAVPLSESLTITSLQPYTVYSVRVAAMNRAGLGEFSEVKKVRTQSIQGEPDVPALSVDEMKVAGNSFTVPLKQADSGLTPLLHYNMQYRQNEEGVEWKEKQLPSETDSIVLKDLTYGSDYQLEVTAVNANGSSIPASFNFTTGQMPDSQSMTKSSVVGVVMVIFLVVFLVVDATCCYTNRRGLLMTLAAKIFGKRVPGLKMLEEGEVASSGVKLNGFTTPRGSFNHTGVQTSAKDFCEVTCDKAPLTKHEKTQPDRNLTPAEA